jgi:hypothetical protein
MLDGKGQAVRIFTDGTKVLYEFEIGESDDLGFQRLHRHIIETYKETLPEPDIRGFDAAKFALEAASGGRILCFYDDIGQPSVMVRIPCFNWADVVEGGEDKPCSAFVVGGKTVDCIYISKYLNVIEWGRAYSLPNRDPAHTITIDDAREACARKGRGWHLLTNAEWCAIAHWCMKNGTVPRGTHKMGPMPTAESMKRAASRPKNALSITPSAELEPAPALNIWNHDYSPFGITDP